MAAHKFGVTVPMLPGAVDSAALGVSANAKMTDKDVNKFVKLGPLNNYVPVSSGDDIEGVLEAVAAHTVNDGFAFGSVKRRFIALEAEVTGGVLAVGAQVEAALQNALGTPQEYPKIVAGTGTNFKWRVKSHLKGTGQIGEIVLIEPCTA